MSEEKLASFLPEVYRNVLSHLEDFTLPHEPLSTCDDCAMCHKIDHDPARKTFDSNVKCCTFHPRLPNYLVGAIFADEQMEEGQRRLRAKIAAGVGVTPWGIVPPQEYDFRHKFGKSGFGQSTLLLCPYYLKESGLCSIWRHREAVCSTFFCKHQSGKHGHDFWMAFKKWLIEIEQRLAEYSLLQHLPRAIHTAEQKAAEKHFREMSREELEGRPLTAKERKATWFQWMEKEETFYRKCYQSVVSLTPAELQNIVGVQGTIKWRGVSFTHKKMADTTVPPDLKLDRNIKAVPLPSGQIRIVSYSANHPLYLSSEEWLSLKSGGALADELRARAYRHGILTEG